MTPPHTQRRPLETDKKADWETMRERHPKRQLQKQPEKHSWKKHSWRGHAISLAIPCMILVFLAVVAFPPLASGQELTDTDIDEDNTDPFDVERRIEESSSAWLIGLNKRSGQARKLRAPVGRSLRFETLTIRLVSCTRILYPRFEDSAALLSISESEEGVLFKGWMYAQYPSLSAMDHPIYDVWVERCLP